MEIMAMEDQYDRTPLIFVYGTLRQAFQHPMHSLLAKHGVYVGDGWMHGKLYDVKHYPGAVRSEDPQDRVHGEVYFLDDSRHLLSRLDDYEECGLQSPYPHEYHREVVPINLLEQGTVQAWSYVYSLPISGLSPIKNGDYVLFRQLQTGTH
jgi:gamma-glutamylcyclotransferase (GGCT)/AIG2-like uncharacterized protein YtfP